MRALSDDQLKDVLEGTPYEIVRSDISNEYYSWFAKIMEELLYNDHMSYKEALDKAKIYLMQGKRRLYYPG